jgi:D,D-heptose 1,7-bisphosphate phosphatase
MIDAVFLDRDGVINQLVFFPEYGLIDSPLNPASYKLIPGAAQAIRAFNELGIKVIVVSNQPAVAKGKTTLELFDKICQKMKHLLEKQHAFVDAEYYCLHHPKAKDPELRTICDCRKPRPGLILKAAEDFSLDLSNCYLIGDGLTDIQAGNAAGCKSILIGQKKCDCCRLMEEMDAKPDIIASSLLEASEIIKSEVTKQWKYSLIPQI